MSKRIFICRQSIGVFPRLHVEFAENTVGYFCRYPREGSANGVDPSLDVTALSRYFVGQALEWELAGSDKLRAKRPKLRIP